MFQITNSKVIGCFVLAACTCWCGKEAIAYPGGGNFGGLIIGGKVFNFPFPSNKAFYFVFAGVKNAGDNWQLDVQVKDNLNAVIGSCTKSFKVTNGAGFLIRSWICSQGGVKFSPTLINNPGRGVVVLPDFDLTDISGPTLPAGLGACCTEADGPPCADGASLSECNQVGGTFHEGLFCSEINDCPTVSTWGLVIMGMIVLAMGGYFVQRQRGIAAL